MKILWQSAAPWVSTGYGNCCKHITSRIKNLLGYDVAIFAYYGLQGDVLIWNGIQVYPNDTRDWGNTLAWQVFKDCEADIIITQEDVWVLKEFGKDMPWYPYVPIDHDPIVPMVNTALKTARRPIAFCRFGQRVLEAAGYHPAIAYHGVDVDIYKPNWVKRENVFRKANDFLDKFVIGTVATNKGERKNYQNLIQAFARFQKNHPESILYCHTDPLDREGLPLQAFTEALGIQEKVFFPNPAMAKPLQEIDMAVIYNAMDLFVLPSKGEGFGMPIIEAESCGVPVITTKFSACSELVPEDYPWLLTDLTPEFTPQRSFQMNASIANIEHLMEEAYNTWHNHPDEYTDLRDQISKETHKRFNWDTIVKEQWKPILEDIEQDLKMAKDKLFTDKL